MSKIYLVMTSQARTNIEDATVIVELDFTSEAFKNTGQTVTLYWLNLRWGVTA